MQTSLTSGTIDTVLFDLDNTLVPFLDPLRAWAKAWARAAAPEHIEGEVTKTLLELTLRGREDRERAIGHATERWGLGGKAKQASERARGAYVAALRPYEGVGQMLEALHREGYTVGLVTDAPHERATERLEATCLSRRFETVVTRDQTPRGKRGPEPFHLALSTLEAEPHRTAMIGDWPVYDVRWPNRLGMRTILAGWGADQAGTSGTGDEPWAVAQAPLEVVDLVDQPRTFGPAPLLPFEQDGAALGAARRNGISPA